MESPAEDTLWQTLRCKESVLAVAVLAVLVVVGATNVPVDSKMYVNGALGRSKVRADFVASSDTINIGVVWPDVGEDEHFLKGAKLAIDEVNAAGGVLGKNIVQKIQYEDLSQSSRRDFEREGRRVAEKFAYDPSIFAVVGHQSSTVALAASVVYNESGVLYIAPAATAPKLTHLGFQSTFRIINNDHDVGKALVEYCHKQGFKRVALLSTRSAYGDALTNAFFEMANEPGIEVPIVMRRSFAAQETNFIELIAKLKDADADAVLIASSPAVGGRLVAQARQMDFKGQFVAGDGLYSGIFLREAGEAANGAVIATSTENVPLDLLDKRFYESFKKAFSTEPDGWAVQGYDAVMLVARALEKAGKVDRVMVSSVLKHTPKWDGVTAPYSFDETGDEIGGGIALKMVQDGRVKSISYPSSVSEEIKSKGYERGELKNTEGKH